MPLFLLGWAKGLLGFLAKLNPYQFALIALGLFALVQHFEIVSAHRHSRKVETQLAQAVKQLAAISTKRNEQQVVTRDRIVTVLQKQRTADDKARVIEQAPLPGQCKSPQAVLDSDI